LRPVFRDMGRRLAAEGYVVLVPNLYYRVKRAPVVEGAFNFANPDDRAKLTPMRASVTPEGTDRDAVAGVLAATVAEHGGPDIVVHNAGETVLGALHNLTEDEWDRQFNTNLKSIYYTNLVLWPAMVARGGGSIITIASTASFVGFPEDAAYVASKGAVLSMTKAMALDGAPVGIRVNAVCPGFIWTPNLEGYFNGQPDPEAAIAAATTFAPIGRMGTIEDTAGAIAFFASEDASFITGASLLVDGGLLAKA
ncbi:MAG: SDR family oxidoreductase, partial [bacterium]|nr:SDR family oxidoreductase [bacterium]